MLGQEIHDRGKKLIKLAVLWFKSPSRSKQTFGMFKQSEVEVGIIGLVNTKHGKCLTDTVAKPRQLETIFREHKWIWGEKQKT